MADICDEVFCQEIEENSDVDECIEALFLQSTTFVDCFADRRWSSGSFTEVCASAKDSFEKVNERFKRRTSADILAEILFDDSAEKNDNASGQFQHKRSRRVQLSAGGMSTSDCNPNLEQGGIDIMERCQGEGHCEKAFPFEDISHDVKLHPPYLHLGDGENKIVNAYLDDMKVVGYGRGSNSCQYPCYTNPFDPRLTFKGIVFPVPNHVEEQQEVAVGATENYFLADDFQTSGRTQDPSSVADNFLSSYREYLRDLCKPPTQLLLDEFDSSKPSKKTSKISDQDEVGSEECRKLFDKIRSDCVRNIWAHPERAFDMPCATPIDEQTELMKNCDQITKDNYGFPVTIPKMGVSEHEQEIHSYFNRKYNRPLAELDRAMNDKQEQKLFIRRNRFSQMRPKPDKAEQNIQRRKSQNAHNTQDSDSHSTPTENKSWQTVAKTASPVADLDVDRGNKPSFERRGHTVKKDINCDPMKQDICNGNHIQPGTYETYNPTRQENNSKTIQQINVPRNNSPQDFPDRNPMKKSIQDDPCLQQHPRTRQTLHRENNVQQEQLQQNTVGQDSSREKLMSHYIRHDYGHQNITEQDFSDGNPSKRDLSGPMEREEVDYPMPSSHQLKATSEPFVPSKIIQDQATQKLQKVEQSFPVCKVNPVPSWRPSDVPNVSMQTQPVQPTTLLQPEILLPPPAPMLRQEVQHQPLLPQRHANQGQQAEDDQKLQQHIREQQQLIQQHYQQQQQQQIQQPQPHHQIQAHLPSQSRQLYSRFQTYAHNVYGAQVCNVADQKRAVCPTVQDVTFNIRQNTPSPSPALPIGQPLYNHRIALQDIARRPPPDIGYSATNYLSANGIRYSGPNQNQPNFALASALTAPNFNPFGTRCVPQSQPPVVLPQVFPTINMNQQTTVTRGPYFSYNFNLNCNDDNVNNNNNNNNNNNMYQDEDWDQYDNVDLYDYSYTNDIEDIGYRIDVLDNYRQIDFKEKMKDKAIKRASKKARAIRSSLIKVV